MNTHFHLAVSLPSVATFTQAMKELKSEFTKWHNEKNARTGPLWRERFKSLVIENEDYLYACGLYIEYNPVKAGMVKKPYEWPHSSSRHYFLGEQDPLVDMYDHADLPADVQPTNDRHFTKGYAIGSELFQIQFRDQHSQVGHLSPEKVPGTFLFFSIMEKKLRRRSSTLTKCGIIKENRRSSFITNNSRTFD
jgi:putative transposase